MELLINGMDIAAAIVPGEVIATDSAGGIGDELRASWRGEGAQAMSLAAIKKGDGLLWRAEGYQSGTMVVDQKKEQKDKYVLGASSVPLAARGARKWDAYDKITLGMLLRKAAEEMNLAYANYGVEESIVYERVARENETMGAFLQRILTREGAALKISGGKLCAIDKKTVDSAGATHIFELRPGDDYTHTKEYWKRIGTFRMVTPRFVREVHSGEGTLYTAYGEPIHTAQQAERWARNMQKAHNAKVETLSISLAYTGSLAALMRVDIVAQGAMQGEWVSERVEHHWRGDTGTTMLTLRRPEWRE